MNFSQKSSCILLALFLILGMTACSPFGVGGGKTTSHPQQEKKIPSSAGKKTTSKKAAAPKSVPVNWNAPSGGAYPVLKKGENIWLNVSVGKQRVYVKNGNQTLYTMVASTGLDNGPDTTTPLGTYHIQAERGTWFYAPQYKEGAEYWVSWKNHGEFLFHSVPMDKNKHVLKADAEKLGREEDSHGCIHLTIPDAKWIYENIPFNTKVVIHK